MPTTTRTPRQLKLIAEIQRLLSARPHTARDFHRIGEVVRELHPVPDGRSKRSYGQRELEALAEEIGNVNVSLLYQARTFARLYGVAELDRLNEVPWTHLTVLGSVPNRKQRKQLEAFCLRKDASVKDLQNKKRELVGKRSQGGRKPASAKKLGARQTLMRIQQYSQRWLDHGQQLLNDLPSVLPAEAHADANLATLQKLQKQIAKKLRELVEIAEALAENAPGR